MALRLTPDVLDHTAAASLAVQLADHIRQGIADLDLSPGDFVPSENEIRTATGLSRPTIQAALRDLELEGLIVKRQGRRAMVAIPPSQHVIVPGGGSLTPFWAEHGATLDDYTVDAQITKEPATAHDAEFLEVRKSTPILRRRLLESIGGVPVRIHRQAFRYSRVKGTGLVYEVRKETTVLDEMRAAGVEPTHYSETWRPRMPNKAERDLLGMRVHAPVWDTLSRYVIAEDPNAPDDLTGYAYTPVQVSRIIEPCARAVLHSAGRLSPRRVQGTRDG